MKGIITKLLDMDKPLELIKRFLKMKYRINVSLKVLTLRKNRR